jgi:PIN like domain
LRSWGWPVEVHRGRFKHRATDDEWIAAVAEKHWRIITSDKEMESRYHEIIGASKAAIFVLSELKRHEGSQKWIEMLGKCKRRIVHDAHFAPCPFVARVSRDGNVYQVMHLLAHARPKM